MHAFKSVHHYKVLSHHMPLFLCCSNIFRVPYSWWLFQISAQSVPSIFADLFVLGSLKIQRCLIPVNILHAIISWQSNRLCSEYMAGARLESKKMLLHSEGWKGRKAPFEMQQREQNIHTWIHVGFVLIDFPWAEPVFRRWLPEPIPAIKSCLFAWIKRCIWMSNSQSHCWIIVWSVLATCCRANGFFNQQLISKV